jgi:hypothetical protein
LAEIPQPVDEVEPLQARGIVRKLSTRVAISLLSLSGGKGILKVWPSSDRFVPSHFHKFVAGARFAIVRRCSFGPDSADFAALIARHA